jgi:3-hydroxyisobutyrate dehydrogenase
MLPSSPHVRQVYLDPRGIIPTLRSMPPLSASNTLCIDSTTLDVQVGRDVAAEAEAVGAGMVDAPVSGGMTIRHERKCQVFDFLQV